MTTTRGCGFYEYNKISNSKANGNVCALVSDKEAIGIYINSPSHHNVIEYCATLANTHNPLLPGTLPPLTYPKCTGIKINGSAYNFLNSNKSCYNTSYGFHDTAKMSSSCFINNMAFFNTISNYAITIPDNTDPSYPRPLPTIVLKQDNLSTYNPQIPPFVNIEMKNKV